VLAAKLIVIALAGAAFGVFGLIGSMGAGAPLLAAFGVDPQLGETDTWALIGRGVLTLALWGAIGVGLGVLVVNQVAAIVIVIVFAQFIEPILRLVASLSDVTAKIGQFLPGAASDALVGASFYTMATPTGAAVQSLEWWQGGLVLLGIAVVATVIGGATTWRRDVS
jgi:hypothetical protein